MLTNLAVHIRCNKMLLLLVRFVVNHERRNTMMRMSSSSGNSTVISKINFIPFCWEKYLTRAIKGIRRYQRGRQKSLSRKASKTMANKMKRKANIEHTTLHWILKLDLFTFFPSERNNVQYFFITISHASCYCTFTLPDDEILLFMCVFHMFSFISKSF